MHGLFKRIIKDPLTHFALLAAAVFVLYSAVTPDGAGLGDNVIVVDRQALLTHLQYRTKTFEPQVAEQRLAALSAEALDGLIENYVREEALHREALSMGMDANDYIIKRRLIQKVEFLAQGFAEAQIELSQADLQQHLSEHAQDYYVEPKITFTHVFFSSDQRGSTDARDAALTALATLREQQAGFNDAGGLGDRFPYHRNYVEQNHRLVESHFGTDFTQKVFSANAEEEEWLGPYESSFGVHLVLVNRMTPGRQPELPEVRARVAEDARRVRSQERLDTAIDEIVAGYQVLRRYDAQEAESQATNTATN